MNTKEILEKSNSDLELWILQDYIFDNRVYYPFLFYREIAKSIKQKFSSTFLNSTYAININ